MLIYRRRAIPGLTLLALTILSVPAAASGQQRILWQGVVKPAEINVYAKASTEDSIAAILKQDDVVDVLLEISDMGAAWCRVALPGQSEPIGYVLCVNLR